ncbi:endolytic transglycosylase MltG [Nannocystis pusilla]|uniref:Endolytic murein transglycosylase n=1 Tax=Nannocystis pusilla TaxID=889268 RepID=A0A9X3J0J9_9BACT|nr:endolytic transglycosylase MltG [Nannocystis pusilla]
MTAGAHTFRADMTPEQVLAELVRAQRTEETRVTIPEGRNILEVADILAVAGYGDASVILATMRDPALLKELGIEGESVEGYLYPDTYKFPTAATPDQVIRRMVEQHRKVFDNLKRSHREALEELKKTLGWGDREIIIMASLVEKETAAKHERPLIAGVFLNRLRFSSFQPKRLETDPTIIYGCTAAVKKSAACEKFEGRIRRIHLRDPDNPYNTYTHEGLPPGPITNAGKAAFEAVLAPKKSRFLYFVSRNDKTHHFQRRSPSTRPRSRSSCARAPSATARPPGPPTPTRSSRPRVGRRVTCPSRHVSGQTNRRARRGPGGPSVPSDTPRSSHLVA